MPFDQGSAKSFRAERGTGHIFKISTERGTGTELMKQNCADPCFRFGISAKNSFRSDSAGISFRSESISDFFYQSLIFSKLIFYKS